MNTAASPRVCVAVVSYNSAATLPRCLETLAAQTFQDYELLLIDNASDQSPEAMLRGFPARHSCLSITENLGFAGAMSAALKCAQGEFLVALNPDAYPHPTWLAELVAAADHNPDVAGFGSLQMRAAGNGVVDGYGDHYLVSGQAWRATSFPASAGRRLDHCFGICAAAALYRTDALKSIGGFDERFFCFYEDVDVSFRLRLAGFQCAVVPTAIVDHVGGASFEGKSDFADYLIVRNQWWVLIKNMPGILLPAAVLGFAAINLASAVKSPSRARLKGLRETLARTVEFWADRRRIQAGRKITAGALAYFLCWRPGAFLAKTPVIFESKRY